MKHCKDCEPAQEIHFIAYSSVVMGLISEPFFNLMEMMFKHTAEAISNRISMPFFKLMTSLKLGYYTHEPTEKNSWRARCFWEEAIRRGIKMKEFHLGKICDIYVAEYNGKTITFDGLPRPDITGSDSLKWMDNKGVMKKKFIKEGIPVANGGVAWRKTHALKIFNEIKKPVITKPNLGSRSRHTTIHLNTKEDLISGFTKANKLSPLVVVEEELSGYLFRGTLVGEKLAGVIRRDAPMVIGNGKSTLRELLDKENERSERKNGPLYHQIIIDQDAEIELKRQGVSFDDVPLYGQIVTFSQKTSRGCGGTTTEVTEIVHPDNKEMLEHIGNYLKDPLVGVDFIIKDITKSWKEQENSGVIECNSLPFIDLHHYPLFGKPNNIAGKLWDLVMPESKIK